MALCIITSVEAKEKIVLTDKNTVIMNAPFRASSVAIVQQKLGKLASKTKDDLYLVLDSPGGSISAGQALIDYANSLDNKVHTVTIFAASMAYLTAQHLGTRYIVPSGTMMSHRASISGLSGQVPGEANSRLRYIGDIVEGLFQSTAKRVGVPYKDYLRSVYDELWLTAGRAVSNNHADKTVLISCGPSLSGTYNTRVRTPFGSFSVSFSKCPLIRGPVKTNAKKRKIDRHIRRLFDPAKQTHYGFTY